jgi:hypothetical protein
MRREANRESRIIFGLCTPEHRVCRSGRRQFRSDSGAEFPAVLRSDHQRIINMLYTIAVVLIVLWLLGLVTSYTMGGLIHVLLVIAIVAVLLRLISGRSAV